MAQSNLTILDQAGFELPFLFLQSPSVGITGVHKQTHFFLFGLLFTIQALENRVGGSH